MGLEHPAQPILDVLGLPPALTPDLGEDGRHRLALLQGSLPGFAHPGGACARAPLPPLLTPRGALTGQRAAGVAVAGAHDERPLERRPRAPEADPALSREVRAPRVHFPSAVT